MPLLSRMRLPRGRGGKIFGAAVEHRDNLDGGESQERNSENVKLLDLNEYAWLSRRFTEATLQTAPGVLDNFVVEEKIPLDENNLNLLPQTSNSTRTNSTPGVQVVINSIDAVFQQQGISIAFIGEDHTYQNPSKDLLLMKQLERAGMTWEEAVEMKESEKPWSQPGVIVNQLPLKVQLAQLTFQKDVQSYPGSLLDQARAKALILLANGAMRYLPDLMIMEKGLQYDVANHGRTVIKEEDIMNNLQNEFTADHRSAALAAYIFLCVAGGDQSGSSRILIFMGERHKNVFEFFEAFAQHSQVIPWIKRRPRHYLLVRSNVD